MYNTNCHTISRQKVDKIRSKLFTILSYYSLTERKMAENICCDTCCDFLFRKIVAGNFLAGHILARTRVKNINKI